MSVDVGRDIAGLQFHIPRHVVADEDSPQLWLRVTADPIGHTDSSGRVAAKLAETKPSH